jgi:hypothetical protein
MKEAWLRVHAALSENTRLTQRDLKAHLLAKRKRLVGAHGLLRRMEVSAGSSSNRHFGDLSSFLMHGW